MSNGLNVRLVNDVKTIAQGDTASTVIVDLLDETGTVMPNLNGRDVLINFIDKKNEIKYQIETVIFDSRVEFNIDGVIPHGDYHVEFRVYADDETYVFPSNMNYRLKINRSANDYYTKVIDSNGIEIIVNEVIGTIESDFPGLLEHTERQDNPHKVSKEQVGLGNVEDVEQATKEEFDSHASNNEIHVTQNDKEAWNDKADIQDIQEAIDGLDLVDNDIIDNHISDEDLHWREGERAALSQEIEDTVTSGIDNLIDDLSVAGIYGDLPVIDDDDRIIEDVKSYQKSSGEIVYILNTYTRVLGEGIEMNTQTRLIFIENKYMLVRFTEYQGSSQITNLFEGDSSSTVLGSNASSEGSNSTALGNNASARSSDSIALGSNTSAKERFSTALGSNASSEGGNSTALGSNASSEGSNSTTLGSGASAKERFSTALGSNASADLANLGTLGSSTSSSTFWWKAHQFYAGSALGTEKDESGEVRRYPALVSAGTNNTVYTGKVFIDEENVDTPVDLPAHVAPRVRPENIVIVSPNDDLALCSGKINSGRQLIVKADKVGEYSFVVYYDWANVSSSTREPDKSWPRL